MLASFQHPSFEALAKLWNSCLPAPYEISAQILKQNTVNAPLFDWGASVIEIDDDAKPLGFVAVKRSAAWLYKGPDPDLAHVSAIVCPSPRKGLEMMEAVKANLRNRGIYKVVFGQDVMHFFAGCPTDMNSIKDLLTIEGFEEGETYYDVSQDLRSFEPLAEALQTVEQSGGDVSVAPLSEGDENKLDAFLKQEFPGRWRYDVMTKIKAEGRSDFVMTLSRKGEIQGFALTQDGDHRLPINGAVFNAQMGDGWCTLGPIGVAKAMRGKGLGDTLLALSVHHMKKQGKHLCTIDWTGLDKWYGKHGFNISRTYIPFTLRLDEAI